MSSGSQNGGGWLHAAGYALSNGRNSKFPRYVSGLLGCLLPGALFRPALPSLLKEAEERADAAEIQNRVNYYCRMSKLWPLPESAPELRRHKLPRKMVMYFFDSHEYTRYFPNHLRWLFLPGDITEVPEWPSIVKSRPIHGDNTASVLLNLNKVRHFNFVDDRLSFAEKQNAAIFRGKVRDKPKRQRLFRKFYGAPFCDLGDTSGSSSDPDKWKTGKMTLSEQLRFKFILAVEGNDVSSNLKWVMSSNSLAVMPIPEYETWFMEGTLLPDVHYVCVRNDFEDLPDKLDFYSKHTDAAEKIILNAHRHVDRFRDKRREKLISLMVLNKYFKYTNTGG